MPGLKPKSLLLIGGLALSAFLAAFAHQSPSGLWLGWVVLIPLLVAVRVLAPSRALAAGAFWGLCLFLSAALGSAPLLPPSVAALAKLVLAPALYAFAGSYITRRKGFSPVILGLGWVAVEFAVRPLGLQNGLLAGALDQSLIMRTAGYVAGYVVVAFIIVYVNASVLSMLTAAISVPGGSRRAPRDCSSSTRWSIPESSFSHFVFLGNAHARAPPPR